RRSRPSGADRRGPGRSRVPPGPRRSSGRCPARLPSRRPLAASPASSPSFCSSSERILAGREAVTRRTLLAHRSCRRPRLGTRIRAPSEFPEKPPARMPPPGGPGKESRMKLNFRKGWLALALSMAVVTPALAADAPQGTRVTDPAVLASMGFSADAVVYLAPGVTLGENTPWPQEYGLTNAVQLTRSGVEFQGRVSTYAYGTGTGQGDVSFVGGDTFTDAAVKMPSGALWEGTRFWVVDANAAQDIGMFLFASCLPVAGPGSPVVTVLGTGASTGSAGNQS